MRQFFITVLGTIFGIFIFFVLSFFILSLIGMSLGMKAASKETGAQVLTLDLREGLLDHSAGDTLFGPPPLSVVDVARSLNKAKSDNNVKGLFIRANEFGMVPASAEEIRLALLDFKSSGKFVITHSQGFEGTTVMPYMAVSASDEIWQQDTTGFAVSGIRSETPFFGGVFEKLDAQPQFEQFYEYKNAANVYTRREYTDAHREATTSLITSIYDTAVTYFATDRGMDVDAVKAVLTSAPHSAEAALDAGMIDKLGHYHSAKKYAQKKAGGKDVKFTSIKSYKPSGFVVGPTIALIGGQGPVVTGASDDGTNPFSGSATMGGDTVASAFDAAIKDKKVEAIVFRVSTPGGSPAASDQIHDAVARAKDAGKPVIISMGQYAASGGYYVSANADKIVALPTTITGSIGVLGGKVAFRDSFEKIGLNYDAIDVGGDYVGVYSADEPFTQSQRAAYRDQLEDIYVDFTTRVAEGRDMPIERVNEIAKGRVWTGEQAKKIDLVDEFGGIMKAIDIAKAQADIAADEKVYIKRFPRPKTTQQQIEELLNASASIQENAALMRELRELPEVQALLKARKVMKSDQELLAPLPNIQ